MALALALLEGRRHVGARVDFRRGRVQVAPDVEAPLARVPGPGVLQLAQQRAARLHGALEVADRVLQDAEQVPRLRLPRLQRDGPRRVGHRAAEVPGAVVKQRAVLQRRRVLRVHLERPAEPRERRRRVAELAQRERHVRHGLLEAAGQGHGALVGAQRVLVVAEQRLALAEAVPRARVRRIAGGHGFPVAHRVPGVAEALPDDRAVLQQLRLHVVAGEAHGGLDVPQRLVQLAQGRVDLAAPRQRVHAFRVPLQRGRERADGARQVLAEGERGSHAHVGADGVRVARVAREHGAEGVHRALEVAGVHLQVAVEHHLLRAAVRHQRGADLLLQLRRDRRAQQRVLAPAELDRQPVVLCGPGDHAALRRLAARRRRARPALRRRRSGRRRRRRLRSRRGKRIRHGHLALGAVHAADEVVKPVPALPRRAVPVHFKQLADAAERDDVGALVRLVEALLPRRDGLARLGPAELRKALQVVRSGLAGAAAAAADRGVAVLDALAVALGGQVHGGPVQVQAAEGVVVHIFQHGDLCDAAVQVFEQRRPAAAAEDGHAPPAPPGFLRFAADRPAAAGSWELGGGATS